MKTTLLRMAVLTLLVFAVKISSQAQSNSPDVHLSGKLTDLSGYGIGNVRVTAQPENGANAHVWSATSSADGTYFLVIPQGRYRIHFQRTSFVARDFVLDLAVAESRTLDLRLEIERISENVVVTANAQPLEIDRTPAPVDLITREEIDQRQALSLPDLLAMQPGVSIGRTGPIGGSVSVFLDGGDSNFTKVLVDGTPVNQPGGRLDFSNFTLDNVDKIEIVHGAESALYGSDAMSGVIQIISHRGATRTPAVNLFAEGGGFSSARGGAQLSGLLDRFDYSAAGSYFETGGQGQNDGYLNRSFSGNLGYGFSDSNQLRLTVRSNSSYAGIPGPTLQQPPNPSQYYTLAAQSANLSWNFHTGTHWEHRLSGTESRIVDTSADPGVYSFSDQYNRGGLFGQSSYSFRQGAATAGYQYEVENGYPSLISGFHARRNNQAGFLDARWLPASRITLSAGVRAEANTTFGARVVPRAGVVFSLRYSQGFWGDTRARVSYGQGIKEPALEESFGSDPCFPGNPSLRPERSSTFDVGVDQYLEANRVRVSGTFFTNRYRDIVSFAYDPQPDPNFCGTYFNTDLSRARGVNLAAEVRPLKWFSIHGNYTYDDSRVLKSENPFSDPALIPGNRLVRRPVNSGSIILNALFGRLNWNLLGYFSGKRTDVNGKFPNQTENAGYARFDVAASFDFGRGISLYARSTNLFDKQYQDAIGYPALGRDYRIGMNYRFSGRN